MSEFYGYTSYTPPSYSSGAAAISGSGTQSSPYVVTASWSGAKQNFNNLYDNDHIDYCCRVEIWRGNASMNRINFTNQTSGSQRVHVSYSASSNFFNYAGHPFTGPELDGYYSSSCIYTYGQTSASYCSNGSQSPSQRLNGQTRTSDFNMSIGDNIYWAGSGLRDDMLVYNYGTYFFPGGQSNYGSIPTPSVSLTMTIWFEKI
jgi:hypothetical protein